MKKRICCFCQTWESGGIESFLTNVLSRMDGRNLEIDLVTECLKPSVFTQPLEACGVRFIELSGSQNRIRKNRSLFRTLVKERQYDVVHLNIFQGMSLEYAQIAKQAGVPTVIAHSHNSALRKSRGQKVKLLLHRLYAEKYADSADKLWACSRPAAEFMFPQRLLEKRGYTFIPNGIDVEKFRFDREIRARVRRELGVENRFVIGNVGRLCYQKNQSFLLDVFAEVIKQYSNSCLLLIGEGEDRQMLEEKAKLLDIADKVLFYGVSERVEQLLCAADVFAFPSLFEGLGIVAIEAQATGLPVVCSEYVPDETHITSEIKTVSLDQPAEIWAAELLKQNAFKREKFCADVMRAGFGITDVADAIEAAYKENRDGTSENFSDHTSL